MKIRNKSALIISILIPLAVGSMSALFSGNMLSYSILDKPAFSPPGFIFPIVWTILYILMGISSYIVYSSNSPNKPKALLIYGIQLFFNFCWSIIFFGLDPVSYTHLDVYKRQGLIISSALYPVLQKPLSMALKA